MELVTGALGRLVPKLMDLLKDEYKLQTGVKDEVRSLALELENAHAALRKVAEVLPDQLDELVKIWAREVRESSYDMEDILDTYVVHVKGSHKPDEKESLLKSLGAKMTRLFKKIEERRKIAGAIKKIKKNLQEVSERHGRYTASSIIVAKPAASSWTVDPHLTATSIVAKPAASSRTVDPRLAAMYREASQIIGIDKSSADLISMLSLKGVDESNQKMKIVSVVGVGGLGKTTLAKAVYDQHKSLFDRRAFVPVGQDPDVKKVLRDVLVELNKEKYRDISFTTFDERQLIDELRDFLRTKRYFVVMDDIWEPQSWETIKLALLENNCGSRIIITTRKFEVAEQADEAYKLEQLSHHNSKELFYTRLFGGEDKCPNNHPDELSDTILKKCGGIPLAIITMASFLLGKSRNEWIEVCNSPGFCQDKNDRHMDNTMHILSLSYYDLPYHLKTCLLYLSVFPEDSLIDKDQLIWMWIAEGFVEKKPGRGSFEVGEEYFHELINRSMIQAVDSQVYGIVNGCRVHDMVLDLIVLRSREEKFASADGTLSESHTRRLAPKNRELDLTQVTDMNLPQVRSFIVWECAITRWAMHPRLKLVRVLALVNCTFREGCQSLEHIGNLHHLRYLRIRSGLRYEQLPEEIGNLKFLQTLVLQDIGYLKLPCSIGRLTQLVCLRAPDISAPVGVIGKLTSLEDLHISGYHDKAESQRQFAKELGNLCELRMLKINGDRGMDESMQIDLLQSLGNLKKMQHLTLENSFNGSVDNNAWDAVVPSQDLQCLFLPYIRFDKLPSWMSSAHLSSVSHLDIFVYDLDEQGLKALGGLPELRYLKIYVDGTVTSNTETDGCFQELRSLVLCNSMVQFVTNEDSSASFTICHMWKGLANGSRKRHNSRVVPAVVMPKLEELEFSIKVKDLMEKNIVSCDNLGFECLPSLQMVKVHFWCNDVFEDDVKREEAALRHAIEVHPNHPALQLVWICKEDMKRRSDDDRINRMRRRPSDDDAGSTVGRSC